MKHSNVLNASESNISNRVATPRFLEMSLPHAKVVGPVLGILLANLLFKAVTAKYSSYVPLQLSYQPTWLTYTKPVPSYDYRISHYPSQWYPVKSPNHVSSYQTYPTLTTGTPHTPSAYQYQHQHQNLAPSTFEYDTHYPEEAKNNNVVTNIDNPITNIQEPIPAESNINVKRRAPQNFRRRTPQRGSNRNKYSQKRKRTTTTPPDDYYYDSYEEFTTETNRRRRPYIEESTENYNDDYYDYETTTKKKQRRKPTKKRRGETTTSAYSEFDSDEVNNINPQTEIVIVRQAQTTTTTQPTTLITNGTTTEQPTISTTSSRPNFNTTTNSTGYGYGPSNGNEGISITYGPPVSTGNGKYYYSSPYFDWYTHDATRNAIVKRVRDIVSFDKQFNLDKKK